MTSSLNLNHDQDSDIIRVSPRASSLTRSPRLQSPAAPRLRPGPARVQSVSLSAAGGPAAAAVAAAAAAAAAASQCGQWSPRPVTGHSLHQSLAGRCSAASGVAGVAGLDSSQSVSSAVTDSEPSGAGELAVTVTQSRVTVTV